MCKLNKYFSESANQRNSLRNISYSAFSAGVGILQPAAAFDMIRIKISVTQFRALHRVKTKPRNPMISMYLR